MLLAPPALGELLFRIGRRRDAAHALRRLLAVQPGHPPGARYYEGALFAGQHRYREAIERWDEVIAADPDGPFGRRAWRDRRTADDLARSFGDVRPAHSQWACPRPPSRPLGAAETERGGRGAS